MSRALHNVTDEPLANLDILLLNLTTRDHFIGAFRLGRRPAARFQPATTGGRESAANARLILGVRRGRHGRNLIPSVHHVTGSGKRATNSDRIVIVGGEGTLEGHGRLIIVPSPERNSDAWALSGRNGSGRAGPRRASGGRGARQSWGGRQPAGLRTPSDHWRAKAYA
ncbi:hypothetical protein HYQ46_009654 [Verticillium longisporum]|nr:hypothetical protein HYQ46_009654 [Verticillium longisporum]